MAAYILFSFSSSVSSLWFCVYVCMYSSSTSLHFLFLLLFRIDISMLIFFSISFDVWLYFMRNAKISSHLKWRYEIWNKIWALRETNFRCLFALVRHPFFFFATLSADWCSHERALSTLYNISYPYTFSYNLFFTPCFFFHCRGHSIVLQNFLIKFYF